MQLKLLCFLVVVFLSVPSLSLATPPESSRQQILQRAVNYANYRYFVTPQNLTPEEGEEIGGKLIMSAVSADGSQTGVPYKWGGDDDLETFQAGLNEGKKAGDRCNPIEQYCHAFLISSQAVGVDSAGFLSRVWDLPRKYSTTELSEVGIELPNLETLKTGDMLLKRGTALLFSQQKDERLYVYEVSREQWKVILNSYTADELSAFTPYRYQNLSDGGPLPAQSRSSSRSGYASFSPVLERQLDKCDEYFLNFYLTIGSGQTAFTCYQEVLGESPRYPRALFGLEKIEVYYFARVKSASDKELWEEAQLYMARLGRVNPDSRYLAKFEVILQMPETTVPAVPQFQQPPSAVAVIAGNSPYHGLIQQAARRHNVPAALIASVIDVESAYDPNAVSSSGAVGLMQVKPVTGEWMGGSNMYDPADNINTGTKYIRYLLDMFNQNMEVALAAYNQGPTRVREQYNGTVPPKAKNYVAQIMNLYRERQRHAL